MSERRAKPAYRFAKPLVDLAVGLAGLLVTLPLIAVIVVAIRLTFPGLPFYIATRAGRGGNPIRVFNFRAMVADAEQIGPSSTSEHDPRLTRIGKLLRKFKVEELPQVINVVKAEMSLVGPRSQVLWVVEGYSEEEREALSVRPGFADYAFVPMPSEGDQLLGSTDPDGDYLRYIHPEKMAVAPEYARRASLAQEMIVLLDTAFLSFFDKALFLRRKRREVHERWALLRQAREPTS